MTGTIEKRGFFERDFVKRDHSKRIRAKSFSHPKVPVDTELYIDNRASKYGCLLTYFWSNSHPNTIHYDFWSNFHPNSI